ncbi:unnamed protein product, partial [Ascophyllum nodosum]
VPDWQPRILLGMVEARSVDVKTTTTTTYYCGWSDLKCLARLKAWRYGLHART